MPVRWWVGLALVTLPGSLCAQEADLKAALALERTFQRVIDRAEPAVATLLVSRSELYQKFGQDPADVARGQLGGFDPDLVLRFGKKLERDTLLEKLDLAHPRHVPESFGSGVVIDPSGLILTNFHVVRDATKVFVRLPGGTASYADIHAADARADLAVLRLNGKGIGKLTPLPLGNAGKLKRGQFLLTLGNPFAAGFRDGQPSASWGILSNVRRRVLGMRREEDLAKPLHQYGTLLQADFRLNLGSSGGPLLNLDGEMVGLTTAWAGILGGDAPGGFAIPIDVRFHRIIEILRKGEEVEYGFLGIALPERDDAEHGVVVAQVYPGSPAERDGNLIEGDRITAIDGEPIETSDDLFFLLGAHLAGTKVKLGLNRPGFGKKTATVTLAKFWSPGKKIATSLGNRPFVRGMRVDDASVLVQQMPRWPAVPPGVLVSEVQKGSAADRAGLKAGDVILRIGGAAVSRPAAFYRDMAERKGPVEFTLYNPATGGPGDVVTVK